MIIIFLVQFFILSLSNNINILIPWINRKNSKFTPFIDFFFVIMFKKYRYTIYDFSRKYFELSKKIPRNAQFINLGERGMSIIF